MGTPPPPPAPEPTPPPPPPAPKPEEPTPTPLPKAEETKPPEAKVYDTPVALSQAVFEALHARDKGALDQLTLTRDELVKDDPAVVEVELVQAPVLAYEVDGKRRTITLGQLVKVGDGGWKILSLLPKR